MACIDQYSDISFVLKVPHNATKRMSVGYVDLSTDTGQGSDINESNLDNINDFDDEYMCGEDEGRVKSIHSLNNTTADVTMQQDLNCNIRVQSIINYYSGLDDRCKEQTFGCGYTSGCDIDPEDALEVERLNNHDLKDHNP